MGNGGPRSSSGVGGASVQYSGGPLSAQDNTAAQSRCSVSRCGRVRLLRCVSWCCRWGRRCRGGLPTARGCTKTCKSTSRRRGSWNHPRSGKCITEHSQQFVAIVCDSILLLWLEAVVFGLSASTRTRPIATRYGTPAASRLRARPATRPATVEAECIFSGAGARQSPSTTHQSTRNVGLVSSRALRQASLSAAS